MTPTKNKPIIVPDESAGARLDRFLTETVQTVSRSQIQKVIRDGSIMVNDKSAKPHLALKTGDSISVPAGFAKSTKKKKMLARPDIILDIVYEDDDILVVNKPSGLLVHPAVMNEQDTLANALLAHFPAIAKVGESVERPGIMHRLDKEASGLLVVAKTKRAYSSLKKQFQNHEIIKEYKVLVNSRPPDEQGTVSLHIGRAAGERRMAARHVPLDGDRPAVTHYHVEELFKDAALLTVRTETGRTHQIRAHFRALGCPVVGDRLYGPKKDGLPMSRLFLHAGRLGFKHPSTGEIVEFRAELPKELEEMLGGLGK